MIKMVPLPPGPCSTPMVVGQNMIPTIIAPVHSQKPFDGIASIDMKNASLHKRDHSPSTEECFKRLKDVGEVRIFSILRTVL